MTAQVKVRAKEVLKKLFDDTAQFTEAEVHNFEMNNNCVLRSMLCKEQRATVALLKEKGLMGTYCILKVWDFHVSNGFKFNDFPYLFHTPSVLKITAGPILTGRFDTIKGHEMVEKMEFCSSGFSLLNSDPFFTFITRLSSTAEIMSREIMINDLTYWTGMPVQT